jgi:large subunit ribosomal protein L34
MKVVGEVSTKMSVPLLSKVESVVVLASTKALIEKGQYEHLYRNEMLESMWSLENVLGGLYEEENIEECIKRTYQPNWKRRKAKHGFLARNATPNGRKVNRRRANAGRRISV